MTNLNSHNWLLTIANQSKIRTKYFKLGSYRAILAATLRIWHFFFTFIPSVVLQEMTEKVHSSIHSSNFSREISSVLRRLRFRKCLASFSSNSISPVKKAAEARSTLFCFTAPFWHGFVVITGRRIGYIFIRVISLTLSLGPTSDSSKSSYGLVGVWLTFVSVLFRCR